ncbi:MAG: zinc-dependent metalloprotease [Vicinamibacterales bacterium]|nr:zinc-dependent metalloprotease [Vicinamibacterales bacterium]
MPRRTIGFTLGLAIFAASVLAPAGVAAQEMPTIEDKTAGMERINGYFPMYWDDAAGTLWLEISRFDSEELYLSGLSAGLGSNDIGLDRGQTRSRLVVFERVGPKILMVQRNYQFRASTDNSDERQAVEDAFARSILWGFRVAAETDGRVLVDTTEFLLRDTHGVVPRLSQDGQYRVDPSRSAVHLDRTKGFPQNSEIDVTVTFTSQPQGGRGFGPRNERRHGVADVTPAAEAVTLRQHHSFVQLPGPGYEARTYDPRSGFGSVSWQDYSTPLGDSMVKRLIRRHRLEKVDPTAAVSDAVEPIVYYLDRGTPEPVRSALLEGAQWWNQAFEAAGYRDAFRVEVLPEGADSFDIRYNVINWVHRSTRGWSSGGGVTDPRTGEIIKGVVTLGSLRVRQDFLIAEGLLSPYEGGDEMPSELSEMALARIRQLSAHEVGHTLGLGHNYYASTLGRISVLDYPHPLITLDDNGTIDVSDAYDVGIGDWDKVAINYGYRDFPQGTDEPTALEQILDDAWDQDLIYLTNQDLDANPRVHQWANGVNPADELDRMLEVRRTAMNDFGEAAIRRDMPLATMEEVFVPLYLHHRFQIDAAASAIGGMHYIYAMRGDGREPVVSVPAAEQRAALDALMRTISPSELAVPGDVIDRLPPRPAGFGRHRELFPRYTGLMFDPISPAVVAADHTVAMILRGDRAARMVTQHAVDEALPGLDEVLDTIVAGRFGVAPANGYEAEIGRAVERVIVDRITRLADSAAMPQVRAVASLELEELAARLERESQNGSNGDRAHATLLARDITRFLERPAEAFGQPAPPPEPPGAPIGDTGMDYLMPDPTCSVWWIE